MELSRARAVAEEIMEMLRPACEDIIIAGSVRRQRPEVHDVELVLLPIRDVNIFDEGTDTYSALDAAIASSVGRGHLAWDEQVKRNGPRHKRLLCPIDSLTNLIVELYIADAQNFGNLVTIRTGCAEFSEWLVTSRVQGGGMPSMKRQQGGYLCDLARLPHGIIPCRTEAEFFAAVGVKWVEPERRTKELAQAFRRRTGAPPARFVMAEESL